MPKSSEGRDTDSSAKEEPALGGLVLRVQALTPPSSTPCYEQQGCAANEGRHLAGFGFGAADLHELWQLHATAACAHKRDPIVGNAIGDKAHAFTSLAAEGQGLLQPGIVALYAKGFLGAHGDAHGRVGDDFQFDISVTIKSKPVCVFHREDRVECLAADDGTRLYQLVVWLE